MPSASEKKLYELFDLIYEAALDVSLWPVFLAKLSQSFEGHQATLYKHSSFDGAGNIAADFGIEDSFRERYNSYYGHRNPVAAAVFNLKEGFCANIDHVIDRKEYIKSKFFNDWVRPQKCEEFMTSSLDNSFGVVTGITVLRGRRPFDENERSRWRLLLPHLRRALDIHSRLESAAVHTDGLCTALENIGVGVAIVTGDAQIVFANSGAEQAFSSRSGLVVRDKRVVSERPAVQAAMLHAIGRATGAGRATAPSMLVRLTKRSGEPIPLLVCPLRHHSSALGMSRPLALLVFGGSRRHGIRSEELSRTLGLTPAEARLLKALVAGGTLADHANTNALSRETVRSQMRSVLSKTGTHRQIDAVNCVLTDPVLSRP